MNHRFRVPPHSLRGERHDELPTHHPRGLGPALRATGQLGERSRERLVSATARCRGSRAARRGATCGARSHSVSTCLRMRRNVADTSRPFALRTAASALTHSDATGNLLSLARIEAANAVQTKGLGSALRSSRYWLIAACRMTIEWKLPRRMRWRVSAEKNVSTAFSHEPDVGVK